MVPAERTVVFGSFFEITDAGRDELIAEFQKSTTRAGSAPFVSYNASDKVFVCTHDDDRAIHELILKFKSYIEYETKRAHAPKDESDERDLIDSPRLVPLKNTTLPDEQDVNYNSILTSSQNALVSFADDSDDSSDETSGSESIFIYWEPKKGEIGILSKEIATAIANVTDCFLSPEPASKRVKLMNGSVQKAKDKLERLEPLMEQMTRHRAGADSPVDGILLLPVSMLPGCGVCFVSTTTPPHFDRLIVEPELEANLEQMLVPEEREWTDAGQYVRPERLTLAQSNLTATYEAPTLLAEHRIPEIGLAVNMLPNKPSHEKSSTLSSVTKPARVSDTREPSKFLLPQEQARVKAWTRAIDPEADPKAIPEAPTEPPEDEMQTVFNRRVQDVDSDLEHAPAESSAEPLTNRQVAPDSDDTDVEDSPVRKRAAETVQKIHTRPFEDTAAPRICRRDRTAAGSSQGPAASTKQTSIPKGTMPHNTFFAGIPRDESERNSDPSGLNDKQDPTISGASPLNSKTPNPSLNGTRNKLYDPQQDAPSNSGDATLQRSSNNISESHKQSSGSEMLTPRQSGDRRRGLKLPGIQTPEARQPEVSANQSRSTTQPRPVNARSPPKPSISFDRSVYEIHERGSTDQIPISPYPNPRTTIQQSKGDDKTRQQPPKNYNAHGLVDINATERPRPLTRPPPGFEDLFQSNTATSPKLDIMDEPLDDIQQPTIKPSSPSLAQGQDLTSSTSGSSGNRTLIHGYTPINQLPRAKIRVMRQTMIAQLQGISDEDPVIPTALRNDSNSSARIAEDDEAASRVFHKTMNLKAPNPGRGKKKNNPSNRSGQIQQETAAERQLRIQQAMQDAHGLPAKQLSTQSQSNPNSSGNVDQLSKRLLQAAKTNPEAARSHAATIQQSNLQSQAIEFRRQLAEVFDKAQAFAGRVSFNMQFGQVLVPEHPKINPDKVYERDKWEARFGKEHGSLAVKFSKILTDNGADMDRLIECKIGSSKIWNKQASGMTLQFEFHCQDQSLSTMKLILNTDGQVSLERDAETIGKIAFSRPGCVWDACAVVQGQSVADDVSKDIEEAMQQLRSTIYVKPGSAARVFYRNPPNGAFHVQHIRLRRVSQHECLVHGESELSLQIVEVKDLLLQNNRDDTNLWKAFESDHKAMAEDGRVFYEASIIHNLIDHALKTNHTLELGELSENTSGKSLLPLKAGGDGKPPPENRALLILGATLRMIDRIDWMGQRNYSTQSRRKATQEEFDRGIATLPLQSIISRAPAAPFGRSAIGGSTRRYGAATTVARGTIAPSISNNQPIHGVRTGTKAELWHDSTGNLYLLGLGGARIPLANDDVAGGGRDVVPGDSASQVGGTKVGRRRAPDPHDRGPGFW